jgi:hypothetical protein
MSKVEIRMPKECSNDSIADGNDSSFWLCHSFVIRAWTFGIFGPNFGQAAISPDHEASRDW